MVNRYMLQLSMLKQDQVQAQVQLNLVTVSTNSETISK